MQFGGTIYTFGFGSDHDASLLEAISTQGGGVYYYIDSNEKVIWHTYNWGERSKTLCSHRFCLYVCMSWTVNRQIKLLGLMILYQLLSELAHGKDKILPRGEHNYW